jgi:hypothetical protein
MGKKLYNIVCLNFCYLALALNEDQCKELKIKSANKFKQTSSVADPGCFIPYPNIFSSRIQIQTFFSPWILHEKWNANLLFSCFLCFQEQSLSLIHSQKDLRSVIQKFIPDPGVKKHRIPNPDLQHCRPVFNNVKIFC